MSENTTNYMYYKDDTGVYRRNTLRSKEDCYIHKLHNGKWELWMNACRIKNTKRNIVCSFSSTKQKRVLHKIDKKDVESYVFAYGL